MPPPGEGVGLPVRGGRPGAWACCRARLPAGEAGGAGDGTGPALALHGVLGQTCVVLGGSPCEAGHPSLDLGESCFEDAALVFLSFPVDKKGNANLGRL